MAYNRRRSRLLSIIILILAVIVIALAGVLVYFSVKTPDSADAGIMAGTEPDSAADEKTDTEEINKADTEDIDFTALKELNPDVCGYIRVPGTEVDCPIVCAPDDPDYYLNNEIEGVSGVFMQNYNSADFSDRHTVIYSKGTGDDDPLAGLFSFEDADFYKANKFIYVYTQDKVFTYRIFAARKAPSEHLMLGYDWNVDQIYLDYLIGILNSRNLSDNIDRDTEISTEDRIITLSAHIKGEDESRYQVQGVLVSEDTKKTP